MPAPNAGMIDITRAADENHEIFPPVIAAGSFSDIGNWKFARERHGVGGSTNSGGGRHSVAGGADICLPSLPNETGVHILRVGSSTVCVLKTQAN